MFQAIKMVAANVLLLLACGLFTVVLAMILWRDLGLDPRWSEDISLLLGGLCFLISEYFAWHSYVSELRFWKYIVSARRR